MPDENYDDRETPIRTFSAPSGAYAVFGQFPSSGPALEHTFLLPQLDKRFLEDYGTDTLWRQGPFLHIRAETV